MKMKYVIKKIDEQTEQIREIRLQLMKELNELDNQYKETNNHAI